MKNQKRHSRKLLSTLLVLCMVLAMVPITVLAATEINKVEIDAVKYDYYAGDKPEATARRDGETMDQYDIKYECWEEMEIVADGNAIPVKFWYGDERKNDALAQNKKITAFEEGKSYMYSISLRARDGYTFANNCEVVVNGVSVDAKNVQKNASGLFITAIKTIKPTKPITTQEIEAVEINNVTLDFHDGDKPVFTGECSDSRYKLIFEAWRTDDAGISSEEWFNNDDHLAYWGGKLITAFDKNKTYTYELVFSTSKEGADAGWIFGSNTKLRINGKEVEFVRSAADNEQSFSVTVKQTMTPQASSGTTPDYKIIEGATGSWTQNSDGTLTFRADGDFSKFTGVKVDGALIDAENYTAASGSTIITLKNAYLKTLSAGAHRLTVVYMDGDCSTNFEIKAAQSIGGNNNANNSNDGNTTNNGNTTQNTDVTSPQTDDNSNLALWIALLTASVFALTGTTVYSKRKKVR